MALNVETPSRFAASILEPVRSAPSIFEYDKSAAERSAPVRFTFPKLARTRFAPCNLHPVMLAANKSAASRLPPCQIRPVRSAPRKSALARLPREARHGSGRLQAEFPPKNPSCKLLLCEIRPRPMRRALLLPIRVNLLADAASAENMISPVCLFSTTRNPSRPERKRVARGI